MTFTKQDKKRIRAEEPPEHLSTCASRRIANRGENPTLTCDCIVGDNRSIYEKIRSEYYKNNLPYSGKSNDKEIREAWGNEESRLTALFKHDCEKEFKIVGHQKADKLFQVAWSMGHSSGYSEVWNYYQELVELVK